MKSKYDLSHLILILVAVGLLATNVLLVLKNNELHESLAQSKKFVTDVGYKFSPVPATTLNGDEAPLIFDKDGKRTALFVFNTNCQYCYQQYPHWKTFINSLDRAEWNVFAITNQTDASLVVKHLEENDLSGLEVRVIPSETIGAARLGFTPMTVLVDANGSVSNVWAGLWTKGFSLGG